MLGSAFVPGRRTLLSSPRSVPLRSFPALSTLQIFKVSCAHCQLFDEVLQDCLRSLNKHVTHTHHMSRSGPRHFIDFITIVGWWLKHSSTHLRIQTMQPSKWIIFKLPGRQCFHNGATATSIPSIKGKIVLYITRTSKVLFHYSPDLHRGILGECPNPALS